MNLQTKRTRTFAVLLATALSGVTAPAFAQVIAGDPGPNVNVVGPTIDPADLRDYGLKQQNEPACAIRPTNPSCIICAYNDYRTVDYPEIGDAWQGVSMSCDAGNTFTSRIAPGHALDLDGSIGESFAADPRFTHPPGMAIFNFIAGDRDSDAGVIAIQHWLEVNKEDADFYEPGQNTIIADEGSEGRFIDKGELLFVPEEVNRQDTVTISTVMENPDLGTITRVYPSGTLYLGFAVFTGSNSVKINLKTSTDLGVTWRNKVLKLSEEQNEVSGISLTAMGQDVLAVWRRAGDINDPDSIMYSVITNNGNKATKGEVLADICSFDQISAASPTAVTFRTNDFPWATYDGKNAYVFYSDRDYDGNGDCVSGRPRIVFKHSADGETWSTDPIAVDDSDDGDPLTTDDAGDGFQFMPTAFTANGKVQVAWYDTRREALTAPGPAVVADYFEPALSANVNRKVDVYTARIVSDVDGNVLAPSPAVRVSQYRIAAEVEDDELGATVAIEGEASFPNAKLYASGSLSFIGDYIAMTAPEFRQNEDGLWISNASAVIDPLTDVTDFYAAWADNRDVRGNILPLALDEAVPYSPPETGMANNDVDIDSDVLLAGAADGPLVDRSRTAEGIDGTETNIQVCSMLAEPADRTRDANIYGSMIRDRVRLIAPTINKPLTGLQRAFAVAIQNSSTATQSYRLQIANQPCDDTVNCRASFRQLPAVPPFDDPTLPAPELFEDIELPAKATFARTVFVVANLDDTAVVVNAFESACVDTNPGDYETSCQVLASIPLGGSGPEGLLQQPSYQSPVCDPTDPMCTDDVLQAELHNPELINPELINPELINPELINPELMNPELINPELINPELINLELENLGFANPELINPELINPELINPELINPELINPELINTTLGDGITWTDYTFAITNTGNVTTSMGADITISGSAADSVDSQIIAWVPYITPTSRECDFLPQFEARVLAAVNNPDNNLDIASIDDPFAGAISAIAVPGETIFFTRRVFGTATDLQNIAVNGFTAASQAANCTKIIPDGEDPSLPYYCETSLADDRERIVLDTLPPEFNVADGLVFNAEADRPGGACVDLVGSGSVTADDNGTVITPVCVADTTGTAICTDIPSATVTPLPLNAPGAPTGITCTAEDAAGNIASVSLFVDVQDNGAPVFDAPLAPADPPYVITQAADDPAGDPSQALVAFPTFTATDDPLVDEVVDVSCIPASGSAFSIGSTTVACTATDDGFNSAGSVNSALASFTVVIEDVTAPVGTPPVVADVEANTEGGADFDYPLPTFTDNFDAAADITIDCDPAAPAFFPLASPGPTTTVSCTGTDTAGNSAVVTFDVTVDDTQAPVFDVVPTSPVLVGAGADGTGSLDFEAQVEVSDVDGVDPDPTVTCVAAGGELSGDPLPFGDTVVTCDASDDSGNSSSASYTVTVQYGASFGIDFNNGNKKAGSTVPLTFGWLDSSGARVDSSAADPTLTAIDCATGTVVLDPGQFPGNSDLRYDAAQDEWKFNWQTVLMDGSAIPAERGGTDYCLQVISGLTGQTVPDTGYTEISIRP
ncbi:MAG: PxKF domain-containing protein [Gammaproteobacteria bacterium]|nr:PxKF domain-containing protein [Gammaproteobacteria bacterium]